MTDLVRCTKCKQYPAVQRDGEGGFTIACCGKSTSPTPSINKAGKQWQALMGVYTNPDIVVPSHPVKAKRTKAVRVVK